MNKRILIVDDSPTVRSRIEWTLVDQGYSVTVARDGLEALAVLQQHQPDLLLLDLFLPFLNGIQICGFIRNHLGWDKLPIIIISGQASKSDITRALNAGANNYLLKPIQDLDLTAVLQTYLPSHKAISISESALNKTGEAL
jgi:CheY-like chemotaxis protein